MAELVCKGCGQAIQTGQFYAEWADGVFHAGFAEPGQPDCVPGPTAPEPPLPDYVMCGWCGARGGAACAPGCRRHERIQLEVSPEELMAILLACGHWLADFGNLVRIPGHRKATTAAVWARTKLMTQQREDELAEAVEKWYDKANPLEENKE